MCREMKQTIDEGKVATLREMDVGAHMNSACAINENNLKQYFLSNLHE